MSASIPEPVTEEMTNIFCAFAAAAAKAQKIFVISSVTGSGIDALIDDLGQFLLDQTEETQTRQKALEQRAGQESHDYSLLLREARRKRRQVDEDDDHEVTVHYER